MRALILIALTFAVFFLLFGCTAFENALNKKDVNAPSVIELTNTIEVPVLGYDANKIIYYNCDGNFEYCLKGWSRFASFSSKYLNCQVMALDEKLPSDVLSDIKTKDVKVRVFFDRVTTYTENGYPRETSQYNTLLRNLVDVQTGNVTESFCVNDKGVLLSMGFEPSQEFSKPKSSFYVIYSTELSSLMIEKFFESFSN
jgi:hypothetical protein